MKSEGVEVVDLTNEPVNDVAYFLQQAAQQGFHPKAVVTETAYDPSFLKLLGNPPDAAPLVMPLTFALFLGQDDSSVPEINTMTSWIHKTHPGDVINLYDLEGWSAGLLFADAMAKAGAHPTSASLRAGLESVTSFNADGLLPADNPAKRIPPVCAVITRVINGKFTRIDPKGSGFECNGKFVPYNG